MRGFHGRTSVLLAVTRKNAKKASRDTYPSSPGVLPEVLVQLGLGLVSEQDLTGLAEPGCVLQDLMADDEGDLGPPAEEILEADDHLMPRRLFDLAPDVLGVLDEELRHPGVGANVLQHGKRPRSVPTPETRAEPLDGR